MSNKNARRKRFGRLIIAGVFAGLVANNAHSAPNETLNFIYSRSFPSGNVLENGSFEGNYSSVDFDSWSEGEVHDAAAYGNLLFSDIAPPRSGRKMAGVRFVPPVGSSRFLVSNPFPLKPNTWYTFFVYYQNIGYNPTAGEVYASFKTYKDRDILESTSAVPFPTPGHRSGSAFGSVSVWTQYSHRFFTGDAANFGNVALLSSDGASAGGAFFFDDAYLVEGCVRTSAGESIPSTCMDNVEFGEDLRYPDSISITQKFFNGNNQVVQTLLQDGPRDIITQAFYDDLGRTVKSTLPIGAEFPATRHQFVPGITALNDPGDVLSDFYDPSKNVFIDDVISGSRANYPDAGHSAFAESRFESSNLGRELESAGSGLQWALGGGHTVKTIYSSVPDLSSADDPVLPTPGTNPYNGEFSVVEITGTDGQIIRNFSDRFGRLVRSSSKLGTGWVITDFEYDGNGNRTVVKAPQVATGERLTTTMEFNPLSQMISETTPVTHTTRFIYDALGRVRFSQTANQAIGAQIQSRKFSFSKYDALGRVTQTGEVTDGSLFTPENAERPEFPCLAPCEDAGASVPQSVLKIRSASHYDDENAQLSCLGGGSSSSPPSNNRNIMYLGLDQGGTVVSASYDLMQTYNETFNLLHGTSGTARILVLYDPLGSVEVIPSPGSEIVHDSPLLFSLEAISLSTPAGTDALVQFTDFLASQTSALLGPGEYLQGRLVKTITCNYELAEALGENAPREVSTTLRYDKFGNVIRVLEINRYTQDAVNHVQLTKNRYDVQNRLIEKMVCSDLTTDPDCTGPLSHGEKFQFDRLGRVAQIKDKMNNTVVQNHFDYIGRLSARGLGAEISATAGNGLFQQNQYHLHGLPKSTVTKKLVLGTEQYREELTYEGTGNTGRFDGNISTAAYSYGSETSMVPVQYAYDYDGLNRLVSSTVDPSSTVANASSTYDYLEDGRLSMMTRGQNSGNYLYDSDGRLLQISGNLVPNRPLGVPNHSTYAVFDYDANGNLVTDISKQKDNQPLEIYYRADNLPYMFIYKDQNQSGGYDLFTLYLAYDGSGQRISKILFQNDEWASSKNYFGSGKEVRERESSSGISSLEQHRLAGVGRVTYSQSNPGGFKQFFLTDHLGSTREVYDLASGKLTYASRYFPYGKQFGEFVQEDHGDARLAGEGVTDKFTGKELDDGIDLSYFGARYYDADIGVWISPDAYRQYASLYSYSLNPVNMVDPDGNSAVFTGGNPWVDDQSNIQLSNYSPNDGDNTAYFFTDECSDRPYASAPFSAPGPLQLLNEWKTETGPSTNVITGGQMLLDVLVSPNTTKALKQGPGTYNLRFGPNSFMDATNNLSVGRHYLGSYRLDITSQGDKLNLHYYNRTSLESATRNPANLSQSGMQSRPRGQGMYGNTYQHIIFQMDK